MRPRSLKEMPTASNSRAYQPDAAPSSRRPPEIWSRLARTLAVTTGLRSGSTITPVPNRMRSVRTAMAVRMVSESSTGKLGSTPSRTWSQAHSDSNPSSSARWE